MARQSAYEYVDSALTRRVFPSVEDIRDLEQFSENLPEESSDGIDIVRKLHQYGSPATVVSTGGRYFGLVNGGAIPAALGARWLTDFWDQNSSLFKTSPVSSKLEDICEN